jgi:RsiW-degrading membrane proteinase PrsW (M82 family)
MHELITLEQANTLMLALIAAAPIVGALCGLAVRKVRGGALIGLELGIGNFLLWKIYNAITDRLGLDTVKNLAVNVALFVAVGIVVGVVVGRRQKRGEVSQ